MRPVSLLTLFLALLAALGSAPRAQAVGDAGSEPALYLGAGARTIGLGRAGATEAGSVYALDWNPAGLAQVSRCEIGLQHAALFGGALHDSLAFAYPVLDTGTFAASVMRLQLGGIERRDPDNLPQGEFDFIEQQAAVAYAVELWGPLSVGGGLKLHDLRLDGRQSTSPGFDLGLLAKWPQLFTGEDNPLPKAVQSIRMGAAVRNAVGPLLKLQNEAERLHPTYRAGLGLDFNLLQNFPSLFSVRIDCEKPERADFRWHAGLEFSFLDHFAVRGGWDQEYPSAGAGVQWAGFTLDYAVSFPAIGLRHLVSLTADFGDDLRDIRARRAKELELQRKQIADRLKDEIIADYDRQARELIAAGNYHDAVKFWEKVLDWEPNDQETQANLKAAQGEIKRQELAAIMEAARKYFREERYVDAMVECRRALDLEPRHNEALQLYAQSEKKATTLGEMAFAKEVKALAKIKEHYMKGLQAYAGRDWEGAISHWEQVIVESPLQKQVYVYLDKARAQMDKARQAGGKQLSAAEQKRRDLYKEAVSLSRSGNLKDATATWEKILKENPQDEDAKKNLEKTRQDLINSEKRGLKW